MALGWGVRVNCWAELVCLLAILGSMESKLIHEVLTSDWCDLSDEIAQICRVNLSYLIFKTQSDRAVFLPQLSYHCCLLIKLGSPEQLIGSSGRPSPAMCASLNSSEFMYIKHHLGLVWCDGRSWWGRLYSCWCSHSRCWLWGLPSPDLWPRNQSARSDLDECLQTSLHMKS